MTDCIVDIGYRMGDKPYRYRWHDGKNVLAHRLAYCEHNGVTLDSIEGYVVRHQCDNPPCTNGRHLLLGTQADNMRDKAERDRAARPTGNLNGRAVLSWDIVRAMRASGLSALALGRRYGCSKATAQKVLNNLSWKE